MPETPNLPEAKSSDGEKGAPTELKGQLAGVIIKSLQDAGAGPWIKSLVGAGAGGLIASVMTTDLPIKVVGGALGGVGTIAVAVVAPAVKEIKNEADAVGEDIANVVKDAAKKRRDRPFEEQYWECQALECLEAKSTGIPQYDGIFVPLLEEVFVELRLDRHAQMAGYGDDSLAAISELEIKESCDRLQIWDLLKEANKAQQFRRSKRVTATLGSQCRKKSGNNAVARCPTMTATRN